MTENQELELQNLKRQIAVVRNNKSSTSEEKNKRAQLINKFSKQIARIDPPKFNKPCKYCGDENPFNLVLHHKRNEVGQKTSKLEVICRTCRKHKHNKFNQMNLKNQIIYEINKRNLEILINNQ